jgi:hypothetical protein
MATYPAAAPARTQPSRPSISSLVLGLVEDLKELVAQEVRLAKHEIQD